MQILGYSERGLVNALLYDILYSSEPNRLLGLLLDLAHFPFETDLRMEVSEADILIEQSFSDFGDADAVFLIQTGEGRACVFLEAKVKPSQTLRWSIETEFRRFKDGLCGRLSSSNLFTQLYHKSRMVMALRTGGIASLESGIAFPECSAKQSRKIGRNPVVREAVKKVMPFLETVFYLAVLPDTRENLTAFFGKRLADVLPDDLPYWETHGYGYLAWADVEDFCRRHGLLHALGVFEFNEGQVYGDG